jgi:hypothetical protein
MKAIVERWRHECIPYSGTFTYSGTLLQPPTSDAQHPLIARLAAIGGSMLDTGIRAILSRGERENQPPHREKPRQGGFGVALAGFGG